VYECKNIGNSRREMGYFYETVDYLPREFRDCFVGRSHPLTATSRANIGIEPARETWWNDSTQRRYTCTDTIPVDTWERGHASSSPLRACPDAPQLRGLFLPSRLSYIFAIMQIISGRLRIQSIVTINRDILYQYYKAGLARTICTNDILILILNE